MTIGKISLDLDNLNGFFDSEDLEVVNLYLKGEKSLKIVQDLIPVITDWELTVHTNEDFIYKYIYRYSDFLPIETDAFEEFKNHKVIDINTTDINNYYANFQYVDGKCITPKKDVNTKNNPIPCLIHLNGSIMTYFIFRWKHYDNHNFEIED